MITKDYVRIIRRLLSGQTFDVCVCVYRVSLKQGRQYHEFASNRKRIARLQNLKSQPKLKDSTKLIF
jgi:hypothetical protein